MTDEPGIGPDPGSAAERGRPLWRVVLAMVLMPLLGAAIGYAALEPVVLPAAGLGTVSRIAALGAQLEAPVPPGTVVFLGSSIVREGIDGAVVEQQAPGWTARNFAISGCSLSEVAVLLPKVLDARPAAVAVGLVPRDRPVTLHRDKAFAYARGGFPAAWAAGATRADFPGLEEPAWNALRASRHAQRMHFRTAPLTGLDDRIRRALRPELREAQLDDWVAPYEMTGGIGGARLERHLRVIGGRTPAGDRAAALRARVVERIAAAGARPILLLLPVHPRLVPAERVADWRDAVTASAGGALVIDATTALPADAYADAIHPSAAGREQLSRLVAALLPPR